MVGGEGKISTATDITLTVDDNSQFVVSGITEEMSSLTLQLQLGTLTCYESEGGIRVTEASDYVVLLSLPSESVSGGSLATDIYRMYPRTLEQAIADGIVSDSEDIEWQTSADGKQYTIVADGDSRYIVVNANANASYYYAFEESATVCCRVRRCTHIAIVEYLSLRYLIDNSILKRQNSFPAFRGSCFCIDFSFLI